MSCTAAARRFVAGPARLASCRLTRRRLADPRPASRQFFGYATTRRHHALQSLLPCRPEHIFDVVADVDSYQEFLPFCTGSNVLHCSADGEQMTAVMAVGFQVREGLVG